MGSKLKFPIDVSVIGTEERNNSQFNKHTMYITQIKVHHLSFNLYLRYSKMQKFAETLAENYKDLIIKQSFDVGNWLTNHKSKVIEIRKGII